MSFNPEDLTGNGLENISPEVLSEYSELKAILDEKQHEASKNGKLLDMHREIVTFVNNLKSIYPDIDKYLFFHLLAGSTPKSDLDRIDFSGNDSIANFIKNL